MFGSMIHVKTFLSIIKMTCTAICLTHLSSRLLSHTAAVNLNPSFIFCCVFCDVCVCLSEPQRAPPAYLPGPGRFLGHAPAVYWEHQPEVWRTPPTQSQQLETSDPTRNSGADERSACRAHSKSISNDRTHLSAALFWNAVLTRMLSAVMTLCFDLIC